LSRAENKNFAFTRVSLTKYQSKFSISDIKMARLAHTPKNIHVKDLPNHQKMLLALQWLHSNPRESPTVVARLHFIEQENSVRKAWLQARKKASKAGEKNLGGAGMNKILQPEQHQAMIRYAVDQATNRGKGATKQMLYNCAMWLRVQENTAVPLWRWFQTWLKDTTELYTIKTKPIASHRVNMHTEKDLRDWFEKEYKPALC
jgi:hypothetical protein